MAVTHDPRLCMEVEYILECRCGTLVDCSATTDAEARARHRRVVRQQWHQRPVPSVRVSAMSA